MASRLTTSVQINYSERLKVLLRDPERKSLGRIMFELLSVWTRNRTSPVDYYQSLLFKKYMTNIYDFVGNSQACQVRDSLNSHSWYALLNNKLFFHLFFESKGIRVPKLLAFSFGTQLHTGESQLSIASESDCLEAFMRIVSKSASGSVFAKPIGGIGGYGTFMIAPDGIPGMTRAYRNLLSTDYIFEETVVQHQQLSHIYPCSVNTLRVDTVRDRDGVATPISALLRMGTGGSFVDNASSGGCFVGVHIDSGKLAPYAYSLPKNGGARFRKHPDSGVVFDGLSIPSFDAVVELACSAARVVPDRNVGWDIAVSKDGPVLIEGNSDYGIRLSEVAYGGYRRNPVYNQMLADYRGRRTRVRPESR